jgi:hypothetical protein
VKARLEIDVVPAGMREDKSTTVSTGAVPAQALSSEPRAQELEAPGNSGATCAAIAAVTVMPLMTVGAGVWQDQVAGQFVEPAAAHDPVSFVVTVVLATVASQVMSIAGGAGVVAQFVRVTE